MTLRQIQNFYKHFNIDPDTEILGFIEAGEDSVIASFDSIGQNAGKYKPGAVVLRLEDRPRGVNLRTASHINN